MAKQEKQDKAKQDKPEKKPAPQQAQQQAQKPKKGRRVSGDPRKAGQAKSGSGTAGAPSGTGALGNLGAGQLPPGLGLPPGFDPSKLRLPGQN